MKHTQQQKGFTLIEMLVVAPIVILTIGAFLTVIISMTGEVLASRASNNLSYTVQDALNHIDQDVKMSSGFLATDNIPVSLFGTAQGYNNDTTRFTNIGGASGTSLILNMVATDTNPVSTGSSYVYLKNQPNACATPQSKTIGNKPFTYNVVYFTKEKATDSYSLYRRVLMPTNYTDTTNTVCTLPWQQPSCLPSYMDSQTGSVFCKTKDIELVSGSSPIDLNIQYFNGQSASTINGPASTAPLAADRTIALQSATTVGVSIYAQQTVAGRTVERSAILRTSRLDGNASGIASLTTDGAPTAPKVAGSITEPTYAKFTWAKVPSATGYTIQYRINGGSWQTGFTNQNTLTYTVTTSTHNDVVDAQVVAINGAVTPNLSSTAGLASVTAPRWISPGLINNWKNYNGSYAQAAYTKTADGLVIMKGLIARTGAVVTGENMFVLPVGYRPEKLMTFQVETDPNAGASVTIFPNGEVTASTNTSAGWVSLSNLTFLASTSPHTFAPLTLINGWTNRLNSADDPILSYTKDAIGRYVVRGSIAGGTNTAGTAVTSSLPPDSNISKHYLMPVRSGSGGDNQVTIASTPGAITTRGTAVGTAYFLNLMYFPDSYGGTWNNLALQNSWVNFSAAYQSAQYTKSSDNIVTLRGMVKSGTVGSGTLLATLPPGYRPSDRLVFASVCADINCRIDITESGTILLMANTSASWTSLDKISFYADL